MPALGLALGMSYGRSRGASAVPPVPGPRVWLDMALETGFSNNDSMDRLTNYGAFSGHFTASGTARGTYKTNRINGQPTVLLDGVDDGYLLTSLESMSAWTLAFVGCLASFPGGTSPCIVALDDYGPDAAFYLFQQSTDAVANVNASMGGINQVGSAVGTPKAFILTGNGTTGTIRSSDNTNGSNSANYAKALANMRLGRRGDGQYANYEYGALYLYNSVLSSTDRTTLWTHFNTRFATAIPATP